jgi:hypothetical protein
VRIKPSGVDLRSAAPGQGPRVGGSRTTLQQQPALPFLFYVFPGVKTAGVQPCVYGDRCPPRIRRGEIATAAPAPVMRISSISLACRREPRLFFVLFLDIGVCCYYCRIVPKGSTLKHTTNINLLLA